MIGAKCESCSRKSEKIERNLEKLIWICNTLFLLYISSLAAMDFPIPLVEVGAPVGLKLDSIRFLSGWLLLNGEVGMCIVGGDTEESGEICRGGSRW